MTKRNRNIKNIFIIIMLQSGTNIMANQVKTPIQNYFEKVLYENLTFEIPPLSWVMVFRVVTLQGIKSRSPPLFSRQHNN